MKIQFLTNERTRNRNASLVSFNEVIFISDYLEVCDEAILQVVLNTLTDTCQLNLDYSKTLLYSTIYGYMIRNSSIKIENIVYMDIYCR